MFHPSSEPNLDSEPSSHIVSQIMITLTINHIIVSIHMLNILTFMMIFAKLCPSSSSAGLSQALILISPDQPPTPRESIET